MIFESNDFTFSILNVVRIDQENVRKINIGRDFDALSFRFSVDTDLTTESSTKHVGNNYLCFVPANVGYIRSAKKDHLIAINCYTNGYCTDDIECFLPKNPENIAKLFKKIYDCWEKKESGYTHRCTAYFYEILAECCVQNNDLTSVESKIQNSVDYINSNFAKPDLSISTIAAKSYISEVYFRKIFKAEFGISPQKHIIKLRIQKAKELIGTGDYSLKEVAFMCGYNDYKYFSAEFRREVGLSPSKYESEKKSL